MKSKIEERKEHEAWILKGGNLLEGFGKRCYYWDIPEDLQVLAKKHKKAFIGLGKWRNINEEFICIAKPISIKGYLMWEHADINVDVVILSYFDLKELKNMMENFGFIFNGRDEFKGRIRRRMVK